MQAGNFCIKHCRDCLIFTQAESEVVLTSLGLWIWDYRTLPRRNIKQCLLCKLYRSLIHTSHSASYIPNIAKVTSLQILLVLWQIVCRSHPGKNRQYLCETRYNLKSNCKQTWKSCWTLLLARLTLPWVDQELPSDELAVTLNVRVTLNFGKTPVWHNL